MASRFVQVLKALRTAFHAIDTERRVRFGPGFYFQIPKLKAQLFSGLGEGSEQTMELSLPDLRIVFGSIRSAYELHELREIKINDLSWTTDCRPRSDAPEHVSIKFKGPLGHTHVSLQRTDIAKALAEFETKFIAAL